MYTLFQGNLVSLRNLARSVSALMRAPLTSTLGAVAYAVRVGAEAVGAVGAAPSVSLKRVGTRSPFGAVVPQ